MLIHRLLAAIVLIPCVILSLFYLPVTGFMLFIVAIFILAAYEWSQFLSIKTVTSKVFFVTLMLISLIASHYLIKVNALSTVFLLCAAFSWWITALVLVILFPKATNLWKNCVVKGIFAYLTLVPFSISFLNLRMTEYNQDAYHGASLLLYVMVLVWATDSGAYFVGRLLGKHKLAPNVSPAKTVEGFLGGTITAFVISLAVYYFNYFNASFNAFIISSLLAIIFSVLGDLVESMFKREAKIKDSGHLIPGHGGILDRIDSLTAAIPIFTLFYCYIF